MSIPIRPLEKIREILASMPETESQVQAIEPGEVLLREGEVNRPISLVVKGEIDLLKRSEEGEEYTVGSLRAGQFLGLLSLSSGEPSFFTAQARTPCTLLTMPRDRFLSLLRDRIDFNQLVAPLLLGNLVDRYRRVVRLHVDVAQLTRDLDREKAELQRTIAQLEATRNRLIQQEKMATLGQLVAGIAHEINNPIASLSRAAESIEPQIMGLFDCPMEARGAPMLRQAFEAGLNRGALQTEDHRRRAQEVAGLLPELPRNLIRTLAQWDTVRFEELHRQVGLEAPGEQRLLFERAAASFEAGVMVRNIRVASTRISHIVHSLKSYSRQDRARQEAVDLREGLQDTLVLFGYILKRFNVVVDLAPLPPVTCRPSEMNQVWTNLILNACQAMGECGTLRVSCGSSDEGRVWVRIQDSGPGIPEDLLSRIFESHFTTKAGQGGGQSGLGLGLAIAKTMVERHGGYIEVANAPEGGAVFAVELPTNPPSTLEDTRFLEYPFTPAK